MSLEIPTLAPDVLTPTITDGENSLSALSQLIPESDNPLKSSSSITRAINAATTSCHTFTHHLWKGLITALSTPQETSLPDLDQALTNFMNVHNMLKFYDQLREDVTFIVPRNPNKKVTKATHRFTRAYLPLHLLVGIANELSGQIVDHQLSAPTDQKKPPGKLQQAILSLKLRFGGDFAPHLSARNTIETITASALLAGIGSQTIDQLQATHQETQHSQEALTQQLATNLSHLFPGLLLQAQSLGIDVNQVFHQFGLDLDIDSLSDQPDLLFSALKHAILTVNPSLPPEGDKNPNSLSAPNPSEGQYQDGSPQPPPDGTAVADAAVNVRTGSSTQEDIVRTLSPGDRYTILGFVSGLDSNDSNDWALVILDDGSLGYIREDLVKLVTPQEKDTFPSLDSILIQNPELLLELRQTEPELALAITVFLSTTAPERFPQGTVENLSIKQTSQNTALLELQEDVGVNPAGSIFIIHEADGTLLTFLPKNFIDETFGTDSTLSIMPESNDIIKFTSPNGQEFVWHAGSSLDRIIPIESGLQIKSINWDTKTLTSSDGRTFNMIEDESGGVVLEEVEIIPGTVNSLTEVFDSQGQYLGTPWQGDQAISPTDTITWDYNNIYKNGVLYIKIPDMYDRDFGFDTGQLNDQTLSTRLMQADHLGILGTRTLINQKVPNPEGGVLDVGPIEVVDLVALVYNQNNKPQIIVYSIDAELVYAGHFGDGGIRSTTPTPDFLQSLQVAETVAPSFTHAKNSTEEFVNWLINSIGIDPSLPIESDKTYVILAYHNQVNARLHLEALMSGKDLPPFSYIGHASTVKKVNPINRNP